MNKKKGMAIAIIAILAVCGGSYGVVHHNNEVQAQQKQEALIKKEKENLESAKSAVDQAYKTRDSKDIEAANKAIDKLSNSQKEEKAKLSKRMTTLDGLLKQLSEINSALEKANKSKTDTNIKSVQTLLDKVTDDYLKNDKKIIQDKLNTLKAQIVKEDEKKKADAKATEEAKVKEAAQAQQTQQDQTAQQAPSIDTTTAQNNQSSGQPVYQEQPQQNYQQPAYQAPAEQPNYQQPSQPNNNQQPAQQTPTKPTPSQPSTPSQPTGPNGGNGTANGAGIVDSPGGWDTAGNVGMGEWQ
ncbi:hypothetical protein ACWY2R_15900 [Enterococcus avium]|uniref:hypothetical protein n=1 Tax=Enterococcus sp. TaxID=35783 RepID=UPI002913B0DA|nr:hypothetical protein [Enterococcus sp.]MDU5337162.1 hypothetical protein [Enterococcus sp.]